MAEDAATTSSRPALGFTSVDMNSFYQVGRGGPGAADWKSVVVHGSWSVSRLRFCLIGEIRTTNHGLRLLRDFRRLNHVVASELLEDRQEAGIKEPDLEEHQEWHCGVNLIGQGVEHRRREIEAKRQLDEWLDADRLVVLLSRPLVAVALDAVLRRAGKLARLAEDRFEY